MSKVQLGNDARPRAMALIPMLVFIATLLGSGLYFNALGVERPFYQVPASVALLLAIIVAFVMYRGSTEKKVQDFIDGATNENVAIMYMTCFLAGAFAEVAKVSGGVDSVVNLGLSIVPPHFITAGIFVIAMFMSLATGSSSGTTAALGVIAFTFAESAGLNMPMVLAAVLCGAFFGDDLSIISDTTIVSTRSQGVELRDKFKLNVRIAAPAAVCTLLLFLAFGQPERIVDIQVGDYSWLAILPYLLVLVFAIVGINVFVVLAGGVIVAGVIGVLRGVITIPGFAGAIAEGFAGMMEIVVLAIFIGGLSTMLTRQGGMAWILGQLRGIMKGPKSTQVGICALVSAADASVANNTAALIITGDICKQVSREYRVDPRRTASLMSIFSCVTQGLIPYGNQILLIGALAMGAVAPIQIIPFMWYNMLLGAFAILSIFVPYADAIIRKDPWNWEHNMAQSKVDKILADPEMALVDEAGN